MATMANPPGTQQPPMMYCYVLQGGDGMQPPADYQTMAAVPSADFSQAQQQYFVPPEAANLAAVQMPQMPGQMMLLTTMMPPHPQQPPQMEQPLESNQPGGWGGSMPPQPPHDQAAPKAAQGRTPTGERSKALKIMNPNSGEEVTGPRSGDGMQQDFGFPGAPGSLRDMAPPAAGGRMLDGTAPPVQQQLPAMPQAIQAPLNVPPQTMQPGLVAPAMWAQVPIPQQPMPQMAQQQQQQAPQQQDQQHLHQPPPPPQQQQVQPMPPPQQPLQQQPHMFQQQPPQQQQQPPQPQQQQPPPPPQQQQQHMLPQQQQAQFALVPGVVAANMAMPAGGGPPTAPPNSTPTPAPTAPKKKGLQNKRIDKPARPDGPGGASGAAPSSPTSAGRATAEEQAVESKAPSGDSPGTGQQAAQGGGAASEAGTPASNAPPASTPSTTTTTTATTGRDVQFQARLAAFNSGHSAPFASSIKALNLEPMRTNPTRRGAPNGASMALRHQQPGDFNQAPLPLVPPLPPSQRNQQQQQQQPQQQQPPPQQLEQHRQEQQPPQLPQQQVQPQLQLPQPQLPPQPVQMVPQPQPQVHMEPVPPAQPQPQQAAAVGGKRPLKLKNAALTRPGRPAADDRDKEEKRQADEAGSSERQEQGGEQEEDSKAAEAESEPSRPLQVGAVTNNGTAMHGAMRSKVIPTDGIFDRLLMLKIWRMKRFDRHPTVAGLFTKDRPGEKGTPLEKRRGVGGRGGRETGHEATDRSHIFGTDVQKKKKDNVLRASEKGYRVTAATGRAEEIERSVRSLLNKICPESLARIVDRLAQVELAKAEELEWVISIIFSKALDEPHYCETYADMVFALRSRYPEFPSEEEGGKPHSFTRVLLNTCQNEFESLPTSFEPTADEVAKYSEDDLRLEMQKRKNKMLANMKFIGNLFLRQLLAVKVIGQIVHDLIGSDRTPEEHMIECVCVLLTAIGYTMDGSQNGEALMTQFERRLKELKSAKNSEGKGMFGKRIQILIQDLLELRANKWVKKFYREQAKTKEEVRKDALKELKAQQRGNDATFTTQVVGMRPAYIDEIKMGKNRQKAAAEGPPKPVWNDDYVRRMLHYYSEERNKDDLLKEWRKGQPSPEEAKTGVATLLDMGFNDAQKEDVIAEMLVELLSKSAIEWKTLIDAIIQPIELLEDTTMDVPNAPLFFHSLLSRLILHFQGKFNGQFLSKPFEKSLQSEAGDFHWQLLVGALKKVQKAGGADAVKKALDIQQLSEKLCESKGGCSKDEMRRALGQEGLL